MATTSACRHSVGKFLPAAHSLYHLQSSSFAAVPIHFNISGGMPSGPLALPVFNLRKTSVSSNS
eukprot:12988196-Alexandrium_andersonii.AAC.1